MQIIAEFPHGVGGRAPTAVCRSLADGRGVHSSQCMYVACYWSVGSDRHSVRPFTERDQVSDGLSCLRPEVLLIISFHSVGEYEYRVDFPGLSCSIGLWPRPNVGTKGE